jgi:hypothetical protein
VVGVGPCGVREGIKIIEVGPNGWMKEKFKGRWVQKN